MASSRHQWSPSNVWSLFPLSSDACFRNVTAFSISVLCLSGVDGHFFFFLSSSLIVCISQRIQIYACDQSNQMWQVPRSRRVNGECLTNRKDIYERRKSYEPAGYDERRALPTGEIKQRKSYEPARYINGEIRTNQAFKTKR